MGEPSLTLVDPEKTSASTCPGEWEKIQKTLHDKGKKTSDQHDRYATRKTAQKLEKKY